MALIEMAGHLIRRLNQISTTTFHSHMKQLGHDITPVQFAAMRTLLTQPNLEQAQIAEIIAYDRATIGGVMDRLEKKNFISRKVNPKDKRAKKCSLTTLGKELILNISPVIEALQKEILSGLSDEEFKQFLALSQKVVLQKNS